MPRSDEDADGRFAGAFCGGLLDPDRRVPDGVAGPHGKAAVKRYDVYRNNVTASLIEALGDIYPATRRIVGEAFFRDLARVHIRSNPPTSPLLFEFGRAFPAFIDTFEHTSALPWLGDVARIERAWLDAYHAADARPLEPAALSTLPPEDLFSVRFTAHPALRVLQSAYPAVTIFTANRRDAPVGRITERAGEDALVTRPHLDVMVRRLPAGGAVFLEILCAGRCLGEAAEAAMKVAVDFDLAANIAGMLQAGAFSAIVSGERRMAPNADWETLS